MGRFLNDQQAGATPSLPEPVARLHSFFDASSVLVIGASADPQKTAGKPLYYLSRYGYRGQVCAVNPRHEELFGFPTYASIGDVPIDPELVLIMLPAAGVADAIRACDGRGANAIVVFGNGFADVGSHELQTELEQAASGVGARLLGPNCLGAVNTSNGLAASFSSYLQRRMFRPGHVALATQSGSMGNAILLEFQAHGIGLSKWIATGNEADVDLLEAVEYLVEDPTTAVVAVFAEAFRAAHRWEGIASRARLLGKPIIVLKTGVGARSREAVISHSGKIIGSHRIWENLAELEHLIPVETVEELCDTALAFSQVAVQRGDFAVLGTGGAGVLAIDECHRRHLPVAELSPATKDQLRQQLPAAASVDNPIDPTPTTNAAWASACSAVVQDPAVGLFTVVISSLVRPHEVACELLRPVIQAAKRHSTGVCVTYLAAADTMPSELEETLRAEGALVLPTPVRAVRALAHVWHVAHNGSPADIGPATDSPPTNSTRLTDGITSIQELLISHGIEVALTQVVRSAEEAGAAVTGLPGAAVLKLEDPQLPHKSDHGLVCAGVTGSADAAQAFRSLKARAVSEDAVVIVQPQIAGAAEALVSCRTDPELGPVVTVGAGGVLAELTDDAFSSTAPVNVRRAAEMLSRTRLYRLLAGYRGTRRYDIDALLDLISNVSTLFVEAETLVELELNPVMVMPEGEGAVVVDALVVRHDASDHQPERAGSFSAQDAR